MMLASVTNLNSSGNRDKDNSGDETEKNECILVKPGDPLELTGRIKIKGSEPHTMVVLESNLGADYILKGEISEVLRSEYQLTMITVKGIVSYQGSFGRPIELDVQSFTVID